jgi:hypothetical protein
MHLGDQITGTVGTIVPQAPEFRVTRRFDILHLVNWLFVEFLARA